MKKIISILIAAVMTFAFPVCSMADDTGDMSFRFGLTVDGGTSAVVQPGDDIAVQVDLQRTDMNESFPMYAVQYDIWYNSELFELITDSVSGGTRDLKVNTRSLDDSRPGWSCISASAYSKAVSGDEWAENETIMRFTLKAKKVGSSLLQSKKYYVSHSDGMGEYEASANDASVTIKSSTSQNGGSDTDNGSGGDSSNGGSSGSSGDQTGGGGSAGAGGNVSDNTGNSGTAQPDKSGDMPAQIEKFTDISAGAWYESAVSYVLEKELFSGTSEKTFSPEGTMTRAMLVTVLWRMDGKPAADGYHNTFSDVENGKWYSDAVAWAASDGIVTGYGNGTFGVKESITRQQLAAILYRYAVSKGKDVSARADMSVYVDAADTASWAEGPLGWIVSKGVMTGMNGNRLAPSGTATRAQAAAMLMRFAEI